jgi:hypothetical protein
MLESRLTAYDFKILCNRPLSLKLISMKAQEYQKTYIGFKKFYELGRT